MRDDGDNYRVTLLIWATFMMDCLLGKSRVAMAGRTHSFKRERDDLKQTAGKRERTLRDVH